MADGDAALSGEAANVALAEDSGAREAAAVKIQAVQRGRASRQQVAGMREEETRRQQAATRIQSVQRARAARQRTVAMRKQAEAVVDLRSSTAVKFQSAQRDRAARELTSERRAVLHSTCVDENEEEAVDAVVERMVTMICDVEELEQSSAAVRIQSAQRGRAARELTAERRAMLHSTWADENEIEAVDAVVERMVTTLCDVEELEDRRAADTALLAVLSSVGYEDEEAAAAAAATVAAGIARAVAAAAAEAEKQQQAAAVRIQAAQRGRAARSHVRRKRAARSEQSSYLASPQHGPLLAYPLAESPEAVQAATRIQAVQRGRNVRREMVITKPLRVGRVVRAPSSRVESGRRSHRSLLVDDSSVADAAPAHAGAERDSVDTTASSQGFLSSIEQRLQSLEVAMRADKATFLPLSPEGVPPSHHSPYHSPPDVVPHHPSAASGAYDYPDSHSYALPAMMPMMPSVVEEEMRWHAQRHVEQQAAAAAAAVRRRAVMRNEIDDAMLAAAAENEQRMRAVRREKAERERKKRATEAARMEAIGRQLEREAARLREMRDDNMRIKEEADEARRQAAEAVRLERMQRQRLRVRPPVRADANNPTPKPRSPLAGGVPVGRGRKVPLYLRMQAQFQRKVERAEEELKEKLVAHRQEKAKPVRLTEIQQHAAKQRELQKEHRAARAATSHDAQIQQLKAQLAKERERNRQLREVKESLEAASVGQLASHAHLPQQQQQPRQPHVWTEYPPIATVMPDATDDGPSPLRPLHSEHVSPQQYTTNNAPWLAAGGLGVDSMSESWAREAQQHRSPTMHPSQQQFPYAHSHHDSYAPPAHAVLSPAAERRQRAAGAAERRLAKGAGAGASAETQQPQQMLRRREQDETADDGADDTTELASVRASAVSVAGGDGGGGDDGSVRREAAAVRIQAAERGRRARMDVEERRRRREEEMDPAKRYTLTLEEAVDRTVDALVAFTADVEEGGIRSAAVRDAVAARDAQASENEEEVASDAAPSAGSPRITDRALAAAHVSAAVGARQLESIFADEEEAERGDGGDDGDDAMSPPQDRSPTYLPLPPHHHHLPPYMPPLHSYHAPHVGAGYAAAPPYPPPYAPPPFPPHYSGDYAQYVQYAQQQQYGGYGAPPYQYPQPPYASYPPQNAPYAAPPMPPAAVAPSNHDRARAHVLRGRAVPDVHPPAHHQSPPHAPPYPLSYTHSYHHPYAPPPQPPPGYAAPRHLAAAAAGSAGPQSQPPSRPHAGRRGAAAEKVDVEAVLATADARAHERRMRLMNGDGLFRGSALEKVIQRDEQTKLASACKSNEKAKAVAKRNQYADLVKERFKPKVNLAKRLELQARKQQDQGRKLPPVDPSKLNMAEHNRQYDVHSVFADDGRHDKSRAPPKPRVKPPQPPPQQPPRADAKVSKKAHLMQKAHDMEHEAQRQAAELERLGMQGGNTALEQKISKMYVDIIQMKLAALTADDDAAPT